MKLPCKSDIGIIHICAAFTRSDINSNINSRIEVLMKPIAIYGIIVKIKQYVYVAMTSPVH